jgi:hypothetical protein
VSRLTVPNPHGMMRLRLIQWGLMMLVLANCDRFVGEVTVKPAGKPVPVVNPDYVILRPVSTAPMPGASDATIYGGTIYFRASDRILDLRHFDVSTAKLEDGSRRESYVISIHTTPEGSQLLRAWTSSHLEEQLGVFLDGRLISAATIKSSIDEMIVLDGEFTKPEAEAIMRRLHQGGAP